VQDGETEHARGQYDDNTGQAREVVHEQGPDRYQSGTGD
jgi:hypothetical protein